ncbi:virulence factor Mce-like protein [Mycobacterium sp. MAA66]|uniref:MlaD family protein n=1 Tax=Mycobacterium sp. MAA66 TaxID=3156297 RepID=UPI00351144D4
MPNSFDFEPRSPSNRRLLVLGAILVSILCAVAVSLVAKSKGEFERVVTVTAAMVNVGDGLPAKSDVKFRGVLVGMVSSVTPARSGEPNLVDIAIKQEFASTIPNTVTARVVPSNIFAVSSVQLVDNGRAAPLRAGATIPEDTSLDTVLFQTTLDKLRQLLAAVGRSPTPDSVGPLTALGEALDGRGPRLREAASDLKSIVAEVHNVVGTDDGPTTISALSAAAQGLKATTPALLDALDNAIQPARTVAEKRVAMTAFLAHGLTTTGTLRDAFDHQTDRLINITTELTPVIGVLADNSAQFHPISTRFTQLAQNSLAVFHPERGAAALELKIVLSLSPLRQYVRIDCPRYGELLGPSCATAPETPTAPDLLPALASRGFDHPPGSLNENRPNFAPPRDSVGSIGRLEQPAVTPPDSPTAPPLPAEAPASVGAPSAGAVTPQSAEIPGDIGPVGGTEEKAQLSRIVGGQASAATVMMLGPLVRGATVHITPDTEGQQ